MPNWLYRITLCLLLALVVAFGIRIAELSLQASDYHRNYYVRLGIGEQIDTAVGHLIEGFSLGLIPAGSDKDAITLAMLDGASTLKAAAESYSWFLLWASTAFLLFGALGSLWPSDPRRFARCLLLVASVCLVIGLVAPIMSMTGEWGGAVVKQDSKSILGAARSLHESGKAWVAGLIILFSVVTPTFKLGLSMLAARSRPGRLRTITLRVIHAIGKWSMADVFVVAILLTIYSIRSDAADEVQTRSEIEVGLWFFLAHCLLAMVATHLVLRHREEAYPREQPSNGLVVLALGLVFAMGTLAALPFLRASSQIAGDLVLQPGTRWADSVIAQPAPGRLVGSWESSGTEHGGADDSMVAVKLIDPNGRQVRAYDHQSKGSFDLPTPIPGIYTIVFDNVGLIRSTARSAKFEIRYEFDLGTNWPSSFFLCQ